MAEVIITRSANHSTQCYMCTVSKTFHFISPFYVGINITIFHNKVTRTMWGHGLFVWTYLSFFFMVLHENNLDTNTKANKLLFAGHKVQRSNKFRDWKRWQYLFNIRRIMYKKMHRWGFEEYSLNFWSCSTMMLH